MIDNLVSKSTFELESYRAEPQLQGIALDKNEIPWSLDEKVGEAIAKKIMGMEMNRYPDNDYTAIREAISGYTGIDAGLICVGNGSDELIQMAFQAFINPGDTIAVQNPTFSMYKTFGTISNARVWEYDLNTDFETDMDEFISCLQQEKPKVTIICNPNNPTGKILELAEIEKVLENVPGIVVIDEAYFEFCGITAAGLLPKYENLIILRTFSKAMGIAGLRVGYMLAGTEIISYINRVRPPYNLNLFSQLVAIEVLKNIDAVTERIEKIKSERERLTVLLSELKNLRCYKSWSNYILVRSPLAGTILKGLQETGINIRHFSNPALKDCLRVTVGSTAENDRFYAAVKEVLNNGA